MVLKKAFIISLLALISLSSVAQQVELRFAGCNANNYTYVQLQRIEIANITRGWTDTLFYPDTVLVLTDQTGIESRIGNEVLRLSPNIPNPFMASTEVSLTVAKVGIVALELADLNGRLLAKQEFATLQPGIHLFHLNVADAGVCFLTARQDRQTTSVKMVSQGKGSDNTIEYVGMVKQSTDALMMKGGSRDTVDDVFLIGDQMRYKGFAEKNGQEFEGQVVLQEQHSSALIVIWFDFGSAPNPLDGQPCPGVSTVTDYDGNVYPTVQIDGQCWMKENLKTTHYSDGNPIDLATSGISSSESYRYYPGNDSSNVSELGYLYNWRAAMNNVAASSLNPSGVQGVCPTGWHLPSDAEWTRLTNYVSDIAQYRCGDNVQPIAKALAAQTHWSSAGADCAAGSQMGDNNATGFSALPAGCNCYGEFEHVGEEAIFWSSTAYSEGAHYYWTRSLEYNGTGMKRQDAYISIGYSVRCVLDD